MAGIDSTLLNQLFKYENGQLLRLSKTTKTYEKCGNLRPDNYDQLQINGKKYLKHRIIFAMFHGYFPKFVDHIDNNPQNNLIENLRAATRAQNCQNAKIPKTNKSGFKNVCWHKTSKKWKVQININQKLKCIGYFKDIELADLVAQEARDKYHKEFARNK
jgi:hypothetical protein